MVVSHNLGFPRIGAHREMKKAVEAYWRGDITQDDLKQQEIALQEQNWLMQSQSGLDFIPVGDFTWYDHVLDTSVMLGVIPERFKKTIDPTNINTYFCMARGQAPDGQEAAACEMTKWFDTNYHYIVPEFSQNQTFQFTSQRLLQTVAHAMKKNYNVKPVLLGPLTYLWLGKCKEAQFNRLLLLTQIIPVYAEILAALKKQGVEWVQIDEPILCLDLPKEWRDAFLSTYQQLNRHGVKCLLTTYFGDVKDNLHVIAKLPVDGIHIDLCKAPNQLQSVLSHIPQDKIISLGIIDGRNIWRADLNKILLELIHVKNTLKERLWLAPSCSLLHTPIDIEQETQLHPEIKSWLSFAKQKLEELHILKIACNTGKEAVSDALVANQLLIDNRAFSKRIHNEAVKIRVSQIDHTFSHRHHEYAKRALVQKKALQLDILPTTTIGSFPQTPEIRNLRKNLKLGKITEKEYETKIQAQIATVIQEQELLDLDVLVHGEAERNDMVEYFGEYLEGFAFTQYGWVQSYGSRCVKPPIIYGDVSRKAPITVKWISYAQSLTPRLVKGMLTGPVTILAWSFVRDDQPRSQTALQIALALRDEVVDLESAGIHVIQIDEPAFRELLPLRKSDWQAYFDWAVQCFRVSACGVQDQTQIHTHMCYSEFNDIIAAIAALDADVITLESSRSDMELLKAFEQFEYPNEIGPGVYDIHSPRIPSVSEIEHLLQQALKYIPVERLWVNPDCGLKTRGWHETKIALSNMVKATKKIRETHAIEVM